MVALCVDLGRCEYTRTKSQGLDIYIVTVFILHALDIS